MRLFTISLLLVICLFSSPFSAAQAQTPFTTAYSVTYTINDQGRATVTYSITLTNQSADTYATDYALEIGSSNISSIAVVQNQNPLEFTTTSTATSTIIRTNFSNPVVGKGKQQQFEVSFSDPDVSVLAGQLLEISIPKLNPTNQIDILDVTIAVPNHFGSPSISHPANLNLEQTPTVQLFKPKPADTNSAITMIFGSSQTYSFNLTYHLANTTSNRGLSQIALPPDTAFQQVAFDQITPSPEKIESDPDGNWIATYILKPKETLDVSVSGLVTVYLKPREDFPTILPDQQKHLSDQPHWPVSDPSIKSIARQFTQAQEIYQFIIDKFDYDYSKADAATSTRLGAIQALKQPANVICQEYTDTFVTLARAAGIPARSVSGFALATNSQLRPRSLVADVLHSWPEYFDKTTNQWIPIDPTWADTTGGIDYFNVFDLNHIVFAIHGHNSLYPLPAGYYKLPDQATKDVTVELSQLPITTIPAFDYRVATNPLALLNFSSSATLHLTNITGTAAYQLPLTITTTNSSQSLKLDKILPFSSATTRFTLEPNSSLLDPNHTLTITNPHDSSTINFSTINTQPTWLLPSLLIALGTIIVAGTFQAGRLLVSRRQPKNSLRR